jgi:hypothetical protein
MGSSEDYNCAHLEHTHESEELDLGVVTVKGLDWAGEMDTKNHRICVCSAEGDPRARWLVIGGIIRDTDEPQNLPGGLSRQVMLRSENCSVRCAVQCASLKQGSWLAIL